MGVASNPASVKLVVGFIFRDPECYARAKRSLSRSLGEIDFESRLIPFIYTRYYEEEMGTGLTRAFVSFKRLIKPQRLASIKALTNSLEKRLSCQGKRAVNIDPGYLDKAKLVLASTKDYCHRIYLDRGIFAEITLTYRDKTFQPWDWTYPDYRADDSITIFNRIRELYACQSTKR